MKQTAMEHVAVQIEGTAGKGQTYLVLLQPSNTPVSYLLQELASAEMAMGPMVATAFNRSTAELVGSDTYDVILAPKRIWGVKPHAELAPP